MTIPPNKPPRQKIYVAGPMRGYPQFNFPTFHAVTKYLKDSGHEVFSPADKVIERHGTDISASNATGSLEQATDDHGFSLRQALKDDLEYICLCANMVVFLPGWEASSGSNAEHRTATALISDGMQLYYLTKEEVEFMTMVQERRLRAKGIEKPRDAI